MAAGPDATSSMAASIKMTEWAASLGVKVYGPPIRSKHNTDPYAPRRDDGPGVAARRRRMKSPQGKALYKRCSMGECINAPIPAMEPPPVRGARSPQGPGRVEHVRSRQQHSARPPPHPHRSVTHARGALSPTRNGMCTYPSLPTEKPDRLTDSEEARKRRLEG
jgi:hypothetical protein